MKKVSKAKYIGKTVHVIIGDLDRWGTVTEIDSRGLIHGTWGPELVDPAHDYISLTD